MSRPVTPVPSQIFCFPPCIEYKQNKRPLDSPAEPKNRLTTIADLVVPDLTNAQSVHQLHVPEIKLISNLEAKGIWAFEDVVEHSDKIYHGFDQD